jgi:hypothetical protein
VSQHEGPNSRKAALRSARQAIEHGDRRAALDLLAAVARGEVPADDLEPVVSEALVATARAEQEERDRAALARYEQTRVAGDQVLSLLHSTPWDRSDLARIRAVLDELDQELIAQEQGREQPERTSTMNESRRRLGAGSLEAKLIRGFGPYLYYRFRQNGRHRSVYVGKPGASSSDS